VKVSDTTLNVSLKTLFPLIVSIGHYQIVISLKPISNLKHLIPLIHLSHSVDHQEAPHCGANFHDSVVPFAILVIQLEYSWILRMSSPKRHHSLPRKRTDR
jgi:hypothetical protein